MLIVNGPSAAQLQKSEKQKSHVRTTYSLPLANSSKSATEGGQQQLGW